MKMIAHKGIKAAVDYVDGVFSATPSDSALGVICAESPAKLSAAFKKKVDAHLGRSNTKQKRPSGNILLRMPPNLHQDAVAAAAQSGESLNNWVVGAIARKLKS